MFDSIVARFGAIAPQVDFWSLRLVYEVSESLSMRQGILQPFQTLLQSLNDFPLLYRVSFFQPFFLRVIPLKRQ